MREDRVVHTCNMQYNHVHKDFYFFHFGWGGGGGGGGDILREINGQDHQIFGQDQCEHMLNLVMVIAIF